VAAVTFEIRGGKRLEATLADAAKRIAEMPDGFALAARELANLAGGAAPRRTGRLASSVRPGPRTGGGTSMVTSPLVYAVPVHWGRPAHSIEANPFIFRVADREQARWLKPLEDAAQRICDGVQGA
jgi:hypothetical protein